MKKIIILLIILLIVPVAVFGASATCPAEFDDTTKITQVARTGLFNFLANPTISNLNKNEVRDIVDFATDILRTSGNSGYPICNFIGQNSHLKLSDIAHNINNSISTAIDLSNYNYCNPASGNWCYLQIGSETSYYICIPKGDCFFNSKSIFKCQQDTTLITITDTTDCSYYSDNYEDYPAIEG